MTRHVVRFAILCLSLGPGAGRAADPEPPRLSILVPAYFYPSGRGLKEWEKLIDAAGRAPIVAIANPASGPGKKVDPNYTAVIRRAAKAGVTVASGCSAALASGTPARTKS